MSTVPAEPAVDQMDARLLLALTEHPRATIAGLAERVGLSRNTVHTRLARLDERNVLTSFERRIAPTALGYPLSAAITAQVTQRMLAQVSDTLADIPEVLQVQGISGQTDLLIHVVAVDADDLYRIAARILASPGVEHTTTSLVMRELVPYRITPLLHRAAAGRSRSH